MQLVRRSVQQQRSGYRTEQVGFSQSIDRLVGSKKESQSGSIRFGNKRPYEGRERECDVFRKRSRLVGGVRQGRKE